MTATLGSIAWMQGFRAGQIVARGNNAMVLEAIKMQPGMTGREIEKALGMNRASTRVALHRLKKNGVIECVDGKWRAR